MQLIRQCLAVETPTRPGSLVQALRDYQQVNPKRSLCVLVSDFLQPEPELGHMIAQIGRRHDLVGMRVADQPRLACRPLDR